MDTNIFQYVKQRVKLSDFVKTLPDAKGLQPHGNNIWRCNNVIAGGGNSSSMIINDTDGRFKMFSHGQEHGDVIKLYSLTLGNGSDNQRDAAIGLANHMSVSIPRELLEDNKYSSKNSLINVMDNVSLSAHDYLLNSDDKEAEKALAYLTDRGATMDMIEEWRLGFLPSHNTESLELLKKSGGIEDLVDLGLVSGKQKNFVNMQGRLVFPILNTKGKCVSLSSRVIPGIDHAVENSKYINTRSTEIYDKSSILYGCHLLKNKVGKVIVCEGNFDVMALNYLTDDSTVAVATCGTALSEGHVDLLKKFNPGEVIVFFDSDDAGRTSAAKTLWMTNHISHSFIYAPNTEVKDPWDIYASGGDITIDCSEPMPFTAARIASKVYDRDDGMKWFVESYKKLNYNNDREQLMLGMERSFHVKRSMLQDKVRGVASVSANKRLDRGVHFDLSPAVISLIRALLCLDSDMKVNVGFSLITKVTMDQVMEICGVRTDIDKNAVLTAIKKQEDEDLNDFVYSFYPQPGNEDSYLKSASRNIAANIMKYWREKGVPDQMYPFIPAINIISTGRSNSSGFDQFDFVMDVSSCITKR